MPADDQPNGDSAAAIATLLLAAGALMEDASVTAAMARPNTAAVKTMAAIGADIAALTEAAAVLARTHCGPWRAARPRKRRA